MKWLFGTEAKETRLWVIVCIILLIMSWFTLPHEWIR